MQTRSIGSLTVTVVGLGCNNFGARIDEARTHAVLDAALEAGINFLDTADLYGPSEEFIGRWLPPHRKQIILATKFGKPVEGKGSGARPEYIKKAIEISLERLRTEWVDLYQLHEPDLNTPIGETLAALDEVKRAGLIREIGCSNFTLAQIREAAAAVQGGSVGFVSVQNEYSLMKREAEREVLPECERSGLGFLPFFPLASGLLTGKFRRASMPASGTRITDSERWRKTLTDENLDRVEALARYAESKGRTLLELTFGWLLSRPAVRSVISGATSPEQVRANAGAAGWKLDADDLAAIDAIIPRPV